MVMVTPEHLGYVCSRPVTGFGLVCDVLLRRPYMFIYTWLRPGKMRQFVCTYRLALGRLEGVGSCRTFGKVGRHAQAKK